MLEVSVMAVYYALHIVVLIHNAFNRLTSPHKPGTECRAAPINTHPVLDDPRRARAHGSEPAQVSHEYANDPSSTVVAANLALGSLSLDSRTELCTYYVHIPI